MYSEILHHFRESTIPHFRGVVDNAEMLIQQQSHLLSAELSDKSKSMVKIAVLSFAGAVFFSVGVVFACIALAQGIGAYFPRIPSWGCYGMVGGGAAFISLLIATSVKGKLQEFTLVPRESMRSLQETGKWILSKI